MTYANFEKGLPSHLVKTRGKIEKKLGQKIPIIKVLSLPGDSKGCFDVNKLEIEVVSGLDKNEYDEVVAEELLHCKLRIEGFPGLEGIDEEDEIWENLALTLRDLFDHILIFPQLEKWGYSPRVTWNKICKDRINKQLYRENEVLLAVILAECLLLLNNCSVCTSLRRVYEEQGLNNSIKLAEELVKIIKSVLNLKVEAYEQTVEKCLKILGAEKLVKESYLRKVFWCPCGFKRCFDLKENIPSEVYCKDCKDRVVLVSDPFIEPYFR